MCFSAEMSFGAIFSFIVLWIILELNTQKEKVIYSLFEHQ
jgi:hypothetical protein